MNLQTELKFLIVNSHSNSLGRDATRPVLLRQYGRTVQRASQRRSRQKMVAEFIARELEIAMSEICCDTV